MTYDVTATFNQESAKLSGTFPIEMFCVNASYSGWQPLYYTNMNQDVYGYALNASGNITASEALYTGLPVKTGNVDTNLEGELSQFTISIPNTDRVVESLIQNNNYLRGCKVYTVITFTKYLPSGSEAEYIGENPDYRAVLKENFIVDTTTSNEQIVTFTCRSKFNMKNILVPGRNFGAECAWAIGRGAGYLGSECDPSGNISATTFPTCDGSLYSCRQRNNSDRHGGFNSIPQHSIFITG